MVLIDSGLPFAHLVVERFEYSPVSGEWGDWAVLRLLARLGTEPVTPSVAHLVVQADPSADYVHAAAQAGGVERRLGTAGGDGLEVLWSAAFSVPLEVVEAPQALFKLIAGDRHPVAVALPAPVRQEALRPVLALRPPRPRRQRAIGNARQLAAVATSVAVTATSVPTAALALDVTTPTATLPPTVATPTVTTPTVTTPTAATATPAPTPAPSASVTSTTTSPTAAPTASHSTSTRHFRPAKKQRTSSTGRTSRPAPAAATRCATTTSANARARCRVSAPGSPPVGAALSFGTSSAAPAAKPTSTSTSTPTRTSTAQPGKPTPTPASHHAAAQRPRHQTSPRSSATGGAPLVPSAPTGTSSTPAPSPGSTSSSTSAGSVSALSSTPGVTGPSSWTGTVAANPALTGAVTELSGLLSNGNRPPSFLIPIYLEAGRRYHVPWEVLAAINAVETDFGRDLNTSSAGAVGWMQFEPSTWRQYGMAVDGHSVPNPYDPRDAIFSAARYLASAGAAQDVAGAVFAYNHASWYVDEVMTRARAIATHAQFERATVEHGTFAVSFATGRRSRQKVRYTSGVLSHYDRLIAAANMVSAANFPYVWGGGHGQPARFGPFDCSGSVSYVMQQAGYKVPTTVSGDIPSWKFPAGPGEVTIFYNPTHTFMRIGDRYFGTSGFARPGGGAGWFDVDKLPASYLAQFHEVHVPDLGPDSFDGSQAPLVITPLFTKSRHRHATSTLSFLPLMSTLGPFPGTSSPPALPA